MQSLTEILFSSWIGILTIIVIAFMIIMGFWFNRWIKHNIAEEEAEIARKNKAEHNTPPTA